MFDALGRRSYAWRWWILASTAALALGAAVWGAGLFGALAGSGFADPRSESARAGALAEGRLPPAGADVVLVFSGSGSGPVDTPAARRRIEAAVSGLPPEYIRSTETYWTRGSQRLLARDRRSTLVLLRLFGADESARRDSYEAIADRLARPPAGLTVQRGGSIPVSAQINRQVESDIKRAEARSFPVLLVLLILLIGGVVAAVLPLVIGALAIVGAFALLHSLALLTDVSVFTINIVTMLGLGLAIDYSLFVVSRFRTELGRHATVEAALPHAGHRRPDCGLLRDHRGRLPGGTAGLAAGVLPLHGPRWDGRRRHRGTRLADRAAGAARRPRTPGQRGPHPAAGAGTAGATGRPAPGAATRDLLPWCAGGDAAAGGVRGRYRHRADRAGDAVGTRGLRGHRCPGVTPHEREPASDGAGPGRLPGRRRGPDRGDRLAAGGHDGGGVRNGAAAVSEPGADDSGSHLGSSPRQYRRHRPSVGAPRFAAPLRPNPGAGRGSARSRPPGWRHRDGGRECRRVIRPAE